MTRAASPRILVFVVIAGILLLNALIFGGRMFSWVGDRSSAFLGYTIGRIGWVRSITALISQRRDLAKRVLSLEEENGVLRGEAAKLEEAKREADACRVAANISVRPSGTALQAGIFSYSSSAGLRHAIMNRGSDDGVSVGDVVMTERGELIGVVLRVLARHAIVRQVQDAGFEVTARVAGTEISGLTRSDGSGSLVLDLVQKDEHVDEGAAIVTSGDDGFPKGLTIGTVRSVDNEAATLFQIVRIRPSISDAVHGFVLSIHP